MKGLRVLWDLTVYLLIVTGMLHEKILDLGGEAIRARPWSRQEVIELINKRLSLSTPMKIDEIISFDAVELLIDISGGSPRLIQSLILSILEEKVKRRLENPISKEDISELTRNRLIRFPYCNVDSDDD